MSEAIQSFTVAEMVVTSLEAFLSAAALNLGDQMPDGRQLPAPDPREAWMALLAASGLLNQFSPLMNENVRVPYQAAMGALLERFIVQNPQMEVPVPDWLLESIRQSAPPVASLEGLVAAAMTGLGSELAARRPEPEATTARVADAGLPKKRGSGLFAASGGTGPLPPVPPKPGSGPLPKPGTGPRPG